MRVTQFTLFNGPITTDGYSQAIDLQMVTGFAVQASTTNTLTASISLHVCTEQNPINWVPLDTQATGGASSQFIWNSSTAGYRWIRMFISFGGGSGRCDAVLNCKGRR